MSATTAMSTELQSPIPSLAVKSDKRLSLPSRTLPGGGISHSLAFCILVPPVLKSQSAPRGKGTPGLLPDVWPDSHGGGALGGQAELLGILDQ